MRVLFLWWWEQEESEMGVRGQVPQWAKHRSRQGKGMGMGMGMGSPRLVLQNWNGHELAVLLYYDYYDEHY